MTFEENSYNVIEDAGFVMLCIVTEGDALPSEILELPVLFEEGTAKGILITSYTSNLWETIFSKTDLELFICNLYLYPQVSHNILKKWHG